MHRLIQRLLIAPLLLCLFAFVPRTAAAHKLNVFAYVEGNSVVVETYFGDGKGAKGAVVEVYDSDATLVANGETDAAGLFRFAVPDIAGSLRVVASTGEGHRGEYTMTADDLSGAVPSGGETNGDKTIAAEAASEGSAGPEAVEGENLDEVAARLDRIEAALRNVQRELAQLRRPPAGPSLERVMTGLGFIIGLTGAAMFVAAMSKARKVARTARAFTEHKG